MSDAPSKTRGGRRPGAGRPPTGAAKLIVQERVPPELAQHCKAAQATQPGYLARLIEKDLRSKEMQNQTGGVITKITARESSANDLMVFEVRFADTPGLAEIWEPHGSAPLATVPDDGEAGDHAADMIQKWFPSAELE